MAKSNISKTKIFIIIFFILVLAGFVAVVIIDWVNIKKVFLTANPLLVIPALLFSILSYIASSYAFYYICQLFKIHAPKNELLKLGFITIAIGNLLDLGGVGGYALRISYLKEKGSKIRDVVALSILHTYLGFLSLLTLLIIGMWYLLAVERLTIKAEPAIFYGLGIAVTVISILSLFLFIPPLRKKFLQFIASTLKIFTRKNIDEKIEEFHEGLSKGLSVMRQEKGSALKLMSTFYLSWGGAITSLYFCFLALGQKIAVIPLVAGFSVGIFTGMFSFIPGGVGAQDGSMSGIFALIGINFTTALLIALLFRFTFNIFPNLVSLFMYGGIIKEEVSENSAK